MTRTALVLQRVQDARSRKSTFTKRKKSVFKKAMELGVLCGVTVAVVVWNEAGEMSLFGTTDPVKLVRTAAAGLDKHAGQVVTSAQLLDGDAAATDDDSDDDNAPQTRSKSKKRRRSSSTPTPPQAKARRTTRTAQRAEQAAAAPPVPDGTAAPAAGALSPPHVPAGASKPTGTPGAAPAQRSTRRRAAAENRIVAEEDDGIGPSAQPAPQPVGPPQLHPGVMPLGLHRPPPVSLPSGGAALGSLSLGDAIPWPSAIDADTALFVPGVGTVLLPSVLAQAAQVTGTLLMPSSGSGGSPSFGWSDPVLRGGSTASASPVRVVPGGDTAHGPAAGWRGTRSPRCGPGRRAQTEQWEHSGGMNRVMSMDSLGALLAVSAAAAAHEAPRGSRG